MNEIEEHEEEKKFKIDESQYEPIDEDVTTFINPTIPKKEETPVPYCTQKVVMYRFQRDYVNSVQRFLGFKQKSVFMRHALLSFCLDQKKIIDAKNAADVEFTIAYKKWRKKYLTKLNHVKEKIQELRDLTPSDEGGDPFSVEELME